jgi:hypothetical protein
VEIARVVDRHAAGGELDVLPFARVEAAQEDLLGRSAAFWRGTRPSSPTRRLKSLAPRLGAGARPRTSTVSSGGFGGSWARAVAGRRSASMVNAAIRFTTSSSEPLLNRWN